MHSVNRSRLEFAPHLEGHYTNNTIGHRFLLLYTPLSRGGKGIDKFANVLYNGGMDESQVVALVWRATEKEGTQKALADKIGVDPSFLHDVLFLKRAPTGKVLDYLGLERVVIYRKKSEKEHVPP